MNVEECTAYLTEMREYWCVRLSPSDEFAKAKEEEIELESRRWPEVQ